jgi:pimeloyl-ACP methyl ester carboxylesterase
MSSIYRRPEVQEALERIYADKLAQWPVPTQECYIETRFGPTHMLISGPADAPPLVLLPGLSVTALMWLPNIAAFSRHFRCIAVDLIGDYGRSTLSNPRRAIRTGRGYTNWLLDLLDGLGIDQTHLLAASNGGYAALNLAADAPQRVARLALLAPSGINLTAREILPRIFRYLLFPTETNRNQLIDWFIGNDPAVREAFYQQMWWGLQGLPKVAIPILFPAAKLKRITAPTLLLLGEHDPAIPAHVAQRRVEKYVPQTKTIVIPGVSHVINYQAAEVVEQAVLEFLGNAKHTG